MADPPVPALTRAPIDVAALSRGLTGPTDGALATFTGVVRNHQDGLPVLYLEYEAHEPMAAVHLGRLGSEASRRWRIGRVVVQHRLGRLEIGDISVFVGVAAAHRAEALEACRWIIDTLKAEVPIFKKEHYAEGPARWVGEEEVRA